MTEPTVSSSPASYWSLTRQRVRILIVDDSAASREHVTRVLAELEGVEIAGVESGAQALEEIRRGGVSLILCDYEMPGMSGLQVLAFVRMRHTALELPVLMLTSREEPEIKVRAFRAGANDYIPKQARAEELQARVRTQIELLAAHRRLLEARHRIIEAQKFETVGHLAEALGHELNTPAQYIGDNLSYLAEGLEAIGTLVDALRLRLVGREAEELEVLLQQADFDYFRAEVPHCIEESRQGIAQVSSIIGVMREFGQVGAREPTPQDLNAIVRGAVAVTRGRWHQVAELVLELSEGLPLVQCVGAEIKQVVLYAILNAVKAMLPQDGITIMRGILRFRTYQTAANLVCIEISDNGPGLEQHVLDRVSEPVLGDSHTDEIALALTHARTVIVDEHGGKLELENLDGSGTRLRILLPLLQVRARKVSVKPLLGQA